MASVEIINKIMEKGLLVSPEAATLPDEELLFLADLAEKNGWFIVKPVQHEEVKQKETQYIEDLLKVKEDAKKRDYNDFVSYYNYRYNFLSKIIMNRPDMHNTTSISRLISNGYRDEVSIIGLVRDIATTRSGNKIAIVEDPTGKLTVVFPKSNDELFMRAQDLVLDEVIGLKGVYKNKLFIASTLHYPGIVNTQLKKSPEEEYIVFLGDTHFGSALFLEEEFKNMIKWLKGKAGNEEQRHIAEKVKYVVITGDIVEGIGIYPGQEEELRIKDIREQFREAAHYLSQIPEDKIIITIPGNHDPVRTEEPQPRIPEEYAKPLYDLKNLYLFTNPAFINIGKKEGFEGFNLLLYHGYSLIYYSETIEHIRLSGGQKRVDKVMELLLEKRHLAPSQGSNLFIPTPNEDYLLIKQIPDFFVTGHVHRVIARNYKGISLINSSAWTEISEDQERRGLEPQPGRVIVANLKTRDLKIINFYMGDKSE